jgi:hypothetical protein
MADASADADIKALADLLLRLACAATLEERRAGGRE